LLPVSGRLYFRASQLPTGPGCPLAFRIKYELAVELFREQARIIGGRHLGVSYGGYQAHLWFAQSWQLT
jgi:hypothetical protein